MSAPANMFEEEDNSRGRPPQADGPNRLAEGPTMVWTTSLGAIATEGEGILRKFDGQVAFVRPPLNPSWLKDPGPPVRFTMPWPSDPKLAQSLGTLGEELRGTADLKFDDARLTRFDSVVGALLAAVEKLHVKDWRIGLLTPDNVMIPQGTNDVVLIDLGFSADPKLPGTPSWAGPENPDRDYWDELPEVRQKVAGAGTPPKAHDVRVLARILAAAIAGTPPGELKPVWHSSACWTRLCSAAVEPALANEPVDKATQVKRLAADLRKSGLAELFLAPPPIVLEPPPPLAALANRTGIWIGGAAFAAILAVVIVAAITWPWGSKPRSGSGTDSSSDRPPPNATDPDFDIEVEKVIKKAPANPTDAGHRLADLYKNKGTTPERVEKLDKARDAWFASWASKVQAADRVAADETKRFEAYRLFLGLRSELHDLLSRFPQAPAALKAKEKRCQDHIDLCVRELAP